MSVEQGEKAKRRAVDSFPEGDVGAASLGTKRTRQVTHEGEPALKLMRVQDLQATVNNLMQKETAEATVGLDSGMSSSSPAVARAGGSSSAPSGSAQVSGEGTSCSGSKLMN